MVSKSAIILAASMFLSSLWAKDTKEGCKATVWERHHKGGASKDYHEGSHSSLGSWNDRIASIWVSGPSGCQAVFCEHSNFRGNCLPIPTNTGINFRGEIYRKISSIRVEQRRRRAETTESLEELLPEAEVYTIEEPEDDVYDPLCEAVYHELLETRGEMFANSTIKTYEMERLVGTCEEAFTDQDGIDQCEFYVYAAMEILDDDSILETLFIDDSTVTDRLDEYQRCGLLNAKINSFVESGKFSGVEIVIMDGEEYFHLDEPVNVDAVELVPNNMGQLEAVVSAGSLLAMWIGSTLVKVCRDFDAQTGQWLLA